MYNVIINTNKVLPTDQATLFEDEEVHVLPEMDMTDLVCHFGLYKSKTIARKAGRKGPLPLGWNVFKGNKKTIIYLWNPSE